MGPQGANSQADRLAELHYQILDQQQQQMAQ